VDPVWVKTLNLECRAARTVQNDSRDNNLQTGTVTWTMATHQVLAQVSNDTPDPTQETGDEVMTLLPA